MIMEYAEGGELFDYIIKKDHLSEDETRRIFHQIIDAIDYMHQMGICHRDLKPENILFDATLKNIKIIDFGLSNLYYTNINDDEKIDRNINESINEELELDLLETPCGSPGYAPPEMVLGYSYNGLLTDIWSSGIILFAMLCGSFPFDDDSEQILYSKIIKGVFEFPSDITLSNDAKNLVKKILVVNPHFRANITDIKNDPWFKKDYKPIYGLFLPLQEIPIDNLIIKEMEKNGYKKEEIIKSIKNNRHNEITTFYYLLAKKFSRKGIETVNDLISSSFTKYILEQNKKVKDFKNYNILINLKLIFERLKIEEAEKIEKELKKEIGVEKRPLKEMQKNKENDSDYNKDKTKKDIEYKKDKAKKEEIKDNIYRNEIHNILGNNQKKEDMNNNMHNFSQKKEDNSRYSNNSKLYNIKYNQMKKFRKIIVGSLYKNKKFQKLKKIIGKKQKSKNNLKKFKINSYSLEKSPHSQNNNINNKKELKASFNLKKDAIFNLSFPYQENVIGNTIALSSKREKNSINQGINTSRINTDRINYEKYFSIKQNNKALIKNGNIPLYQKFAFNCNVNKNPNKNRKFKINQGIINKVVKNSKNSAFNVYYLSKNLKLKNIDNNTNNSIKNIKLKNTFIKNVNVQKEKGNMSYRQIQKDKTLFENNLSRMLTVSNRKSDSQSKVNTKQEISKPYNNSSRNKYFKNKKIKNNNIEILDNNYVYKKIKNYHIDSKEKKFQELKLNSNQSKENNINFSININLNLNQIKNTLKEREKTTPVKQKQIKTLKGIKLDLKKINNNYQIYNRNSLANTERFNYENMFKKKQDFIFNKKNNYIINANNLINPKNNKSNYHTANSHSKEEYKIIKDEIFKKREHKQKSFVNHNQKPNALTNSLTKLLPFLKSINSFKTKSIKKESPNVKENIITINNNSNSIINKTNTSVCNNINKKNKCEMNSKIEKIKQNKNLINKIFYKNISNNSYITEIPISRYNILNQEKNNSKKSPDFKNDKIKMKPLNLKGILNENSYIYKSLTIRGEQEKNKIIFSMKDELSKGGNTKKIPYKDEKNPMYIINKLSPNKNIINYDALFEITPFKIKDILLTQLPRYNININQKSSENNYFVFHCLKGLIKIIIELYQIKGNNYIFVQMKCFSGNQKDFLNIRKQILGIINHFKSIDL